MAATESRADFAICDTGPSHERESSRANGQHGGDVLEGPTVLAGGAAGRAASRRWTILDALLAFSGLILSSVPAVYYLRALGAGDTPLASLMPNSVSTVTIACALVTLWLAVAIMGDGRLRWPIWAVRLTLALFLVGLIGWYFVFMPDWAPGSDNADALERGAAQILRWQDPYSAVTKFGNTFSPMLGGFLLALPFVAVLGDTLWMTPFWLIGGVAGLYRWAGPHAALAALTVFGFSVWTRLALPAQSDNWITSTAVVVGGCFGFWAMGRDRISLKIISAVAYGVALSYRFLLWPTVLPLLVLFVRNFGWRRTVSWILPAGVVTLLLVGLPFIIDAQAYVAGPWVHGLEKADSSGVPNASLIVGLVGVAVTVLASLRVRNLADAWGASAISIGSIVVTVAITKYSLGPVGMVSTYETVAFTGTWLVFLVAALVLPRGGGSDRTAPSADARDQQPALSSLAGQPGYPIVTGEVDSQLGHRLDGVSSDNRYSGGDACDEIHEEAEEVHPKKSDRG